MYVQVTIMYKLKRQNFNLQIMISHIYHFVSNATHVSIWLVNK